VAGFGVHFTFFMLLRDFVYMWLFTVTASFEDQIAKLQRSKN
jgi:hypothetical protein